MWWLHRYRVLILGVLMAGLLGQSFASWQALKAHDQTPIEDTPLFVAHHQELSDGWVIVDIVRAR